VVFVTANKRLGPSALAELVSEVQDRGAGEELIDSLRAFDARLEEVNVRYERVQRQATVTVALREADGGYTRQPITSLGDGSRRLVELQLLLPTARDGVGLVDEVDSGIYYESLGLLWNMLNEISKSADVQIFATTHSQECVTAAIEAFDEEPAAFRLHRISRWDDGLRIATYDHETAEAAFELRLEVR